MNRDDIIRVARCAAGNGRSMTTLREAAQQALEALENIDKEFRKHGRRHWPEAVKAHSAIAPLRAALAEPEPLHAQRDALLEALHNISLAAQDSGSTREGMGLYARAAIKQAEEKV